MHAGRDDRMGSGFVLALVRPHRGFTNNASEVSQAKERNSVMADPETCPNNTSTGRGVFLLDDHEVVRRGLRQLLESHGLNVVGESGSAREAVRRIPALRPDLVILDDDLPDGSITCLRR